MPEPVPRRAAEHDRCQRDRADVPQIVALRWSATGHVEPQPGAQGTIANLASVATPADRHVDIYNNAGHVDVIADLASYVGG